MQASRLIAAVVFAGFAGAATAAPALAEDWHHDHARDRHWHDPHWHRPYYGPGVVVAPAPPPVVYAAPAPVYVAPPPVVGLGLNFNIR